MNTKGIKFLAVLAVLAMAFAAFAVVSDLDTDDAAIAAKSYDAVNIETANVIDANKTNVASGNYYVTKSVTISGAESADLVLYLAQGVTATVTTAGSSTARLY